MRTLIRRHGAGSTDERPRNDRGNGASMCNGAGMDASPASSGRLGFRIADREGGPACWRFVDEADARGGPRVAIVTRG